jgi:hypothetical protein
MYGRMDKEWGEGSETRTHTKKMKGKRKEERQRKRRRKRRSKEVDRRSRGNSELLGELEKQESYRSTELLLACLRDILSRFFAYFAYLM